MKKRIISIVVVIALVWVNCYSTMAVTSQEYKAQADAAAANSEKAKDELEDVQAELDTALQEVSELSSSIETVEEEIGALTEKIGELDKSIADKEADLKEKEALLDERLSATYMNEGTNPYIEALFSGGFINFVSNYDMIKQIAEYDTNLINEVKQTKVSLENEKKEVEKAKNEKVSKSEELKKLKDQKQQKVDSLTDEQKQIQSKIDEYDSQMNALKKKEKEQAEREAAEARAAAARAAAMNMKKTSTSSTTSSHSTGTSHSTGSSPTAGSSGRFTWPVPSSTRISSNYGYRIHPIYKTKKLHAGVDIAAAGGANIVAGDSGTVILSSFGYNGGYGNYIIISHGNGVTTRYAHCSNLYVKAGETVSRGQVIAAVGSTGASTGNHCHFEVRINGNSNNPLNYL